MRNTVVESPPTTTARPQVRDAAELAFRRRVQRIDCAARALISFSGIAIICAVLGIGLFLIIETLPLFAGAKLRAGLTQPVLPPDGLAVFVAVDEHQEQAAVLGPEPELQMVSLAERRLAPARIRLEGLEGQRILAASEPLPEGRVALGTDQGLVWIGLIRLQTTFEGADRLIRPLVEPEMVLQVAPAHRITHLAYRRTENGGVVACIVDGERLLVTRITAHKPLIGAAQHSHESFPIALEGLGRPRSVLINESATQVLIGADTGLIGRWRLASDGSADWLETVQAVPGSAVAAMTYLLGDRSVAVGGGEGSVATWSLVRNEAAVDGWRLMRIHLFPSHVGAIRSIIASPRDKGFITASEDGVIRLHYLTSERTLATFPAHFQPVAAAFAPKADGALFMDRAGALRHWRIHNPHPEFSARALFSKLWYEGYEQPEYVWQSSGGTDDFEPKLSLIPLIFGTLKGTFYAMLFAVPLALFGALYCSQFLDKRWRNPLKSVIEVMAALPSVVLGFIAGLVLSPLVQTRIASVLILPVVVPLVAVAGMGLSAQLPLAGLRSFVRQRQFWMVMGWTVVGAGMAWWMGPLVERAVFGGDFEAWLLRMTATRYDQRNSLIVGWAMGFAVIPLVFTICEDAFSAVPRHLIGASLACGASSWQTAWRVVLPSAGSGAFSAVMIGFGRAVGETMIVLMATGNTPIMDWSIFNGFRALSANIAVEIPEAPYGGTLYRVLFVAALLLFSMTFLVNTAAELIRLRLRRQLQGL